MHRTYADWFSFQPNVWAPTLFVRPLDRACDGIEVYKECHITGEEYSVEMMTNDFLLWRDKGVGPMDQRRRVNRKGRAERLSPFFVLTSLVLASLGPCALHNPSIRSP